MRGSLVKRDDRYYVKIRLDPDPRTGRRRQKWHSGYRTKREAERARVDLLSKFDRGEYVEPSHQSLAEFLEEWLRAIEPTVRPSTFDSYARNVRNHVIAHIGSVRLTKVDAGTLNGLYALLLVRGRRRPSRTGLGYSSAVVERALDLRSEGLTLAATAARLRAESTETEHITKDTLASLLRRHAAGEGVEFGTGLDGRTVNYVHVIIHPGDEGCGAMGPAFAESRRRCRSASGWPKVRRGPLMGRGDAAAVPRDIIGVRRPLLGAGVLLATTGMRRGEALGLRWSDVDLDAGRLRVVQTTIHVGSKVTIGEPKTARGRRPIALDAGTIAVLREHRRQSLEERMLVGPDFEDRGLVFHYPDGSCLKPDAVNGNFERRVRRAGLPALTLKGLRHTWATLALERGIHPRVVQERLGHSTIAITLGIYSHVAPTLHDEGGCRQYPNSYWAQL